MRLFGLNLAVSNSWVLGLSIFATSLTAPGCGVSVQGALATFFAVEQGNFQLGRVNEELPQPLSIQVMSDSGNPVEGAEVHWSVADKNGTLREEVTVTDSEGYSWNYYLCGKRAGIQTILAFVPEVGSTQSFQIDALPGPPGKVNLIEGAGPSQLGQLIPANAIIGVQSGTQPLKVQITDIHGNILKGVDIHWEVDSGGGKLIDPQGSAEVTSYQTLSDTDGYSSMHFRVGTKTNLIHRVSVTAGQGPNYPESFFYARVQATAPTTISYVSGNGQTSQTVFHYAAAPFVVLLQDQWNNPVPNHTVQWTITSGQANDAVLSANPPLSEASSLSLQTDANGKSQVFWKMGKDNTVTQTLTATAPGLSIISFTAGTRPDVADHITVDSGTSPVSFSREVTTTQTVAVYLRDQWSNLTDRGQVLWSVSQGGGSVAAGSESGSTALEPAVNRSQATLTMGTVAHTNPSYPGYPSSAGDLFLAQAQLSNGSQAQALASGQSAVITYFATATPARPAQLSFTNFPPSPNSIVSREAFGGPNGVKLLVKDHLGNPTSNSATVTISSTPSGINGTLTQPVSNVTGTVGEVVFNDLKYDTVGSGYRLTATVSSNGSGAVLSSPFGITPGAPSSLRFKTGNQPTNTVAGYSINGAGGVKVEIIDAAGNVVTWSQNLVEIEVSAAKPTFTGSGTQLSPGKYQVRAVNGVASFTNNQTKAATSYTLNGTADFTSQVVTSNPFNVVADVPTSIDLVTTLSSRTAGTNFPVRVDAFDQYLNPATNANSGNVTLTISSNSGTFNGTKTVSLSAGTANFSVNQTKIGTYTITASGFSDTDVSNSFTITPGPAATIEKASSNNGDNQISGLVTTLPTPFKIIAKDQYGNQIASPQSCTIDWTDNAPGGSFSSSSSSCNGVGESTTTFTTGYSMESGNVTETQNVTATLNGTSSTVTFTVTVSTAGSEWGSGKDGAVDNSGTSILNSYTEITTSFPRPGNTSFDVWGTSGFAVDDLVLIIQMQNNSILDNISFPNFHREYARIKSISGNTITLYSGLKYYYSSGSLSGGRTQMIRVPEYTTFRKTSGSHTAAAWNGVKGGIFVIKASTSILFGAGGQLNVTGLGFRGGAVRTTDGTATQGESYRGLGGSSTSANDGGGGGGSSTGSCNWISGGGGSYGTAGSQGGQWNNGGTATRGSAGQTNGDSDIDLLMLGSGGGGTVIPCACSGSTNYPGSNGGGSIILESPTVTTGGGGAIRANGASSIDCSGQAGGGGSGGAIYIKSNSFTGSGGISATGGGSTGGNGRIVIHTLNYTHNGSNPITPTAITTTKDLVETACTAPENGSCTATCPGGYSLFQIKYVKYGASACDSGINSFGSGANCELGPASSNSTSATTTFNNARCIDNCVGTVKAGILIIKCEAN